MHNFSFFIAITWIVFFSQVFQVLHDMNVNAFVIAPSNNDNALFAKNYLLRHGTCADDQVVPFWFGLLLT